MKTTDKSYRVVVVLPKVFATNLNRFREENLGYELSVPLGGPEVGT